MPAPDPAETRLIGNRRIDWLDGWRTVAVVLVITDHLSRLYGSEGLGCGKLGVYLFFGISGFIVTRLLLRERAKKGTIEFRAFYLRRALRILPPLFIYLATCIAVSGFQPSILTGALRSALFTCNMGLPTGFGDCGWLFGHTWSLGFEEQFYLLLPFVFMIPVSLRSRCLLALALAVALVPFVLQISFIGKVGFVQIYMLLGGGALYAWKEEELTSLLAQVPALAAIGLLLFALWWMRLPPIMLQKLSGILVPPAVLIALFSLPLASTAARALLSSKPMRTIGLYSYSLYLWQQLALVDAAWNRGAVPYVLLAGALAFSAFSYRFIETPCRNYARRAAG